eukprot:ctg_5067.g520
MKQVSDPKKSAAVPAEEVKAGAQDAKAGADSAVSGLRDMADEVWHRVETLPDRVRERIESFDAKTFADDSLAFWKQVWNNTITGEWFNRGELYFAIQLGLLMLILRDPGALDPLVGFVLGPATLAVSGAVAQAAQQRPAQDGRDVRADAASDLHRGGVDFARLFGGDALT